ncbi:HRDC domain-containing protein [Deinococcus cellulosilyticus]|nr:HRDC domain-containing protein [Deinococcus cellulosilyticus]
MDSKEALRILQLLADGVDPHSGEVFEDTSPYQHPQVVRALFHAGRALETQSGMTAEPATRPSRTEKAEKPEKPEPRELNLSELSPEERERFEKLRTWRAERARQLNMPQYVIAHNRHLFEMAQLKDLSYASLSAIKGFGGIKAEKYAEEIQRILEE